MGIRVFELLLLHRGVVTMVAPGMRRICGCRFRFRGYSSYMHNKRLIALAMAEAEAVLHGGGGVSGCL